MLVLMGGRMCAGIFASALVVIHTTSTRSITACMLQPAGRFSAAGCRNFIAIMEDFHGTWLNPVAALVRQPAGRG